MKLASLQPPSQQMHWSKTFALSSQEATLGVLHENKNCWLQKHNKNIESAHHQAKCVDHANDLHHSWQAPKRHETNDWLEEE